MSPCHRFEEEALLLLEKGEPLPEHFRTCPDCRRAASKYERLRQDLAEIEEDVLPPKGWQDAVRERILAEGASQDPGTSRRGTAWKSAALAAAALTAAVVGGSLLLSPPQPEGLRMTLQQGEQVRRSTEAAPGDVLTLEAGTSRAAHTEIRLYRNDRELVARCGGGSAVLPAMADCKIKADRLQLTVTLPAVGSYQPLVVRAAELGPEPSGGLDDDTEAILQGGGEIELGDPVEVR